MNKRPADISGLRCGFARLMATADDGSDQEGPDRAESITISEGVILAR